MQKQSYFRLVVITAGLLLLVSTLRLGAEPPSNSYVQHNLVSDVRGLADHLDPNLVNPWGVSFSPTGPFWVSDAGTGVATVYDGQGRSFPIGKPLIVKIPVPPGVVQPSAPTGQVFNGAGGFNVAPGIPAVFLFATEEGTISGWNPAAGPDAIIKVNRSAFGAVYKGLAIAPSASGVHIYAANFHAGAIEVFDSNFNPVALAGAFVDLTLPVGYAPFNIQNVGGELFVTYALQDAAKKDDVAGPGNGYVNEFDVNGNLIRRFATRGTLNAPWGVVRAPAGFGAFGGDLLVGNFGDGRINAFNPTTGVFHGQLHKNKPKAIEIEGLWALVFGNGGNAGDPHKLYFTAGIKDESHGLFGQISPRHDDGGDDNENENEDDQ